MRVAGLEVAGIFPNSLYFVVYSSPLKNKSKCLGQCFDIPNDCPMQNDRAFLLQMGRFAREGQPVQVVMKRSHQNVPLVYWSFDDNRIYRSQPAP